MSDFYRDPDRVDAYLSHRHAPVSSPNLVMEDPAFTDEVGSLAGLDVLDLGCGDGTFASTCVEAGCRSYVGIDGSAPMIDRAKASVRSKAVSFVLATMDEYAPGPDTFDLIVSRMALHYIGDLDRVLARARTASRPGGRLIFSVVPRVLVRFLPSAR